MINNRKVISNLKLELQKVKDSIIIAVRLLNKDEINILIKSPKVILQKFYSIIEEVCLEFVSCSNIKDFQNCLAYIVLEDDENKAEALSEEIHNKLILFTDDAFPEVYFKCSIGGIKVGQLNKIRIGKLISYLHYGIENYMEGNYYFYNNNPVNIENIRAINQKQKDLRSTLNDKKCKFVYQPVVDRASGQIQYYECLLRIIDRNNQFLSVGPIIAEAENNGLINIIDFTVFEMVVKELVADQTINLSINISNLGVTNKKLLKYAEKLLTEHKVAKRLIIEITETSLNNNYPATKKFIDSLHGFGCRFALDDFGAGFTSFKQLLNLPIDIIKIDGSYIRDIVKNARSKVFVEALIKLAEELKIKTVAEYVENGEIAKFLVDIKIDAMQGNFFLPASNSRIK